MTWPASYHYPLAQLFTLRMAWVFVSFHLITYLWINIAYFTECKFDTIVEDGEALRNSGCNKASL